MATPSLDITAFVGKLLEQDDVDASPWPASQGWISGVGSTRECRSRTKDPARLRVPPRPAPWAPGWASRLDWRTE
jgi:hypothetical protein